MTEIPPPDRLSLHFAALFAVVHLAREGAGKHSGDRRQSSLDVEELCFIGGQRY